MGFTVVLLEIDPKATRTVTGTLPTQPRPVCLARSIARSTEELRERVSNERFEVAVLDMEHSRLSDVRSLHRDFPTLPIICTHRVPDDDLWVSALDAGASDVCGPEELENVLTSLVRTRGAARVAFA
jgi:DNA-binding response OmpR family regulator